MYLANTNKSFDGFLNEFFGYNDNQNIKTNVNETNESYLLEMVVAGFSENEIDIKVDNEILTISTNHDSSINEGERTEFYKNAFTKSYRIPKDVNSDAISAKMTNGILGITLPKSVIKPSSKSIKID